MTGLLRLDQVERRFGGLVALEPVSMEIPAGARRAIIGPNGAGKSTLLNLIAGTLCPTGGRILLDGRDVTRLGPTARARRGIGRTWQHPAVFAHLTVSENLALAAGRGFATSPDASTGQDSAASPDRDLIAWSESADLGLRRAGLAASASTPAGALSYGHQRRLELAMALAHRPRLLLLDEPSAGLDAQDLAALTTMLRALPASLTVVLVDHHLDLMWAVTDSVTVLDHGRCLITAAAQTVRSDPMVGQIYPHSAPRSAPASEARPRSQASVLLRVRNLTTGYTGTPVLAGLNLDLPEGQITAVVGGNGSGKTTLLTTLAGLHPAWPPTTIHLADQVIPPGQPRAAARAGISLVPQERRLFSPLTVAEHLRLAEATRRRLRRDETATGPSSWNRQQVLDLLPDLARRLRHPAALLSGGEQQLALARALLARPRLLLLDEPSEGLAPALAADLADFLRGLANRGLTILLADPHLAAGLADQVFDLDHVVSNPGRKVR
jgi:ABC-type branched-subunit amino acid transport system ATPase component